MRLPSAERLHGCTMYAEFNTLSVLGKITPLIDSERSSNAYKKKKITGRINLLVKQTFAAEETPA